MKLYGIRNCDTVKKARKFLDSAEVAYDFHDYKKEGVDADVLKAFVIEFGWEAVLNKRGTTWRRQPDEVKEAVNSQESAIEFMMGEPSAIKRPLVQANEKRFIGFDQTAWEVALAEGTLA
ncbi:ArsC family reductase [Pseudovibrio sp. SPO723]|uniref:ArsC family reductase n=1 Tax=Nesiotobacter zosterae TaxID=392721 RepID=UPI0029C51223|nr:ArsC family reductase [Pseudovibrio sp. SPO723]MDX5594754.1 ArsC family reductase [Pseudovibrio sp. SPO723]